jgi:hypothetical protein
MLCKNLKDTYPGVVTNSFDVSQDCDIIFTVITRLEVRRLKNLVYKIDPKAFVFTNSITLYKD